MVPGKKKLGEQEERVALLKGYVKRSGGYYDYYYYYYYYYY